MHESLCIFSKILHRKKSGHAVGCSTVLHVMRCVLKPEWLHDNLIKEEMSNSLSYLRSTDQKHITTEDVQPVQDESRKTIISELATPTTVHLATCRCHSLFWNSFEVAKHGGGVFLSFTLLASTPPIICWDLMVSRHVVLCVVAHWDYQLK